jgi:hypothetical protein
MNGSVHYIRKVGVPLIVACTIAVQMVMMLLLLCVVVGEPICDVMSETYPQQYDV